MFSSFAFDSSTGSESEETLSTMCHEATKFLRILDDFDCVLFQIKTGIQNAGTELSIKQRHPT